MTVSYPSFFAAATSPAMVVGTLMLFCAAGALFSFVQPANRTAVHAVLSRMAIPISASFFISSPFQGSRALLCCLGDILRLIHKLNV